MGDTPWQGDACSLVDAFRRGERSPEEELEATYAAIDSSGLNAVSYADRDAARDAARRADVHLPFGGVPIGVKELDHVAGWPMNHASLPLAGEIADFTSVMVERVRDRRRRGPRGTDHGERVRWRQRHPHRHPRCHPQPVGCHAHARRVVGRHRRRRGRRPVHDRHRRRWRRLDPHPRRLHRAVRAQGDVRSDPARPEGRLGQPHRHGRVPVPVGARHRPLVRRVQRPRSTRSAEHAALRGVVGGRPRRATRRTARPARRRRRRLGRGDRVARRCGRCSRRRRPTSSTTPT